MVQTRVWLEETGSENRILIYDGQDSGQAAQLVKDLMCLDSPTRLTIVVEMGGASSPAPSRRQPNRPPQGEGEQPPQDRPTRHR